MLLPRDEMSFFLYTYFNFGAKKFLKKQKHQKMDKKIIFS